MKHSRDPTTGRFSILRESVLERFLRYTNKNGPPHPYDNNKANCWIWIGPVFKPIGRARFSWRHKIDCAAARIAFELFKGPLGKSFACHSCDNILCVNPDHLWAGDAKSNAADCVSKNRHTALFGEKNGAHIHKERIQRGDDHYLRRNPDMVRRGEQLSWSKLTEPDVRLIKSSNLKPMELAEQFLVSQSCIKQIRIGRRWGHVCA